MKIETRNVYIADDGKKFDTLEECQSYESGCIGDIERKIVDLIKIRNSYLSRKNRYKANRKIELLRQKTEDFLCLISVKLNVAI